MFDHSFILDGGGYATVSETAKSGGGVSPSAFYRLTQTFENHKRIIAHVVYWETIIVHW
jgi:hypothetical protein